MTEKARYRIGKIHISVTNPTTAIIDITEAALTGKGGYICVSNMRMIRYACKNKEYKDLMEGSFMNLPDGTPLTWLGKLWGIPDIACTNGPALFKRMLKESDPRCRHYLLGDTEDVIEEILRLNEEKYHANIVGAEALPFCDVEEFDYEGITERLNDAKANIVWTAMRAPKQDQFDRILCTHTNKVVAIGDDALIVDDLTADAYADKIIGIIHDGKCQYYSYKVFEHFRHNFTQDVVFKKTLEIYRKIANNE